MWKWSPVGHWTNKIFWKMLLFNVTIVVQSFYPNSTCVVFLKQPVSIRAPHCLKRAVHLIARNSWVKFYTFFIFLFFLLFGPYSGWAFSGLLTNGGAKRPPLPKICQTSYNDETWQSYTLPKKTQKLYESLDAPLEFCWH